MRSSRLLSMLMLLQLRGRTSAAALARELEVSLRTVYRDVDALSATGVPVYAERGRAGGIVLRPGYRTQLTGLTPREAEALPVAALGQAARDLGLGAEATAAQLKLLASLPADAGAGAQRIAARFFVDPLPWYHRAESPEHLPALAQALWRDRRVRIAYESWTRHALREVSPLGLVLKGGLWYLVAAGGRGAGGPRTYRVSGIRQLEVLDRAAERPRRFDLAAHWPQAVADFEARLLHGRATVRLSAEGLRILRAVMPLAAEHAAATQRASGRRGWVEAQVPVEAPAYAARQLLRLGAEVEVLQPAPLRRALQREAQRVLARYESGRARATRR